MMSMFLSIQMQLYAYIWKCVSMCTFYFVWYAYEMWLYIYVDNPWMVLYLCVYVYLHNCLMKWIHVSTCFLHAWASQNMYIYMYVLYVYGWLLPVDVTSAHQLTKLRSIISHLMKGSYKIDNRNSNAKSSFARLHNCVWSNIYLKKKKKFQVYWALILLLIPMPHKRGSLFTVTHVFWSAFTNALFTPTFDRGISSDRLMFWCRTRT